MRKVEQIFQALQWSSACTDELPTGKGDPKRPRRTENVVYWQAECTPLASPKLRSFSPSALSLISTQLADVIAEEHRHETSGELIEKITLIGAGNELLPGAPVPPWCHCYCGHQFGVWAGQLGDGRAISLGTVVHRQHEQESSNSNDHEISSSPSSSSSSPSSSSPSSSSSSIEIQLKGAGMTPYSRSADGRAVLRSSIREFLCSEAMHALGVPTSRAATLVVSDETMVVRDPQYSGNAIEERCAVVMRLAPSWLRFGSYEIFKRDGDAAQRPGPAAERRGELLPRMLDFTLRNCFAELCERDEPMLAMFAEVVERSARLVAEWQAIGWAHGVLNTDNLSVLGITIDYGPFGFVDAYDPEFICNGSDSSGRYALKEQPNVVRWNLERLADAWAPHVDRARMQSIVDERYEPTFRRHWLAKMRAKLGLSDASDGDASLVDALLDTMAQSSADFTNVFRFGLRRVPVMRAVDADADADALDAAIGDALDYIVDTQLLDAERAALAVQPKMPDNQFHALMALVQQRTDLLYRFGEQLTAEMKRRKAYERAKALAADPQALGAKRRELWRQWLVQYVRRLAVDDDVDIERRAAERRQLMDATNPAIVLRNWIAQEAIERAERSNDYALVNDLLRLLSNPFDEQAVVADQRFKRFTELPPSEALQLCVTCSS
jgi:protein adenylyltransferase